MIIRLIKEVQKPTGKAFFKIGTEIPVNKEWGLRLIKEGKAIQVDYDKAVALLLKKEISKPKYFDEEE